MDPAILTRIQELSKLAMPELDRECRILLGRPSWTTDADQVFRRLAWHLQATSEGGLSERAKARAAELGAGAELNLRGVSAAPPASEGNCGRDDRLPARGVVLTREYRGERILVRVLANGFEYRGRIFRSLSAIARQATGTSWNGYHFFGLTRRPSKAR